MCDPATIALAGKIATGVSAATSAISLISSGRAAKRAGDVQAEFFRRQGQRDRELAQLEAGRQAKEGAALAGRQRALLAAGGRDISTGTALLIQTDLAEEVEFQKQITEAGGETQESLAEQRGRLARAEGRTAFKSSLFRAGSTLLKGGAEVASFG